VRQHGLAIGQLLVRSDGLDRLEATGHWQEALGELREDWRSGLSLADPDALHRIGRLLQRGGRLPQAARAYRAALEIDPQRPRTLNNLCLLALAQLDGSAADYWLDRALAVPTLTLQEQELIHNTACSLRIFQLQPEAAAHHAELLLRNKPSAANLSNLATCYRQLARFEEARSLQRQAVALDLFGSAQATNFCLNALVPLIGQSAANVDISQQRHTRLLNLGIFELSINVFNIQAQQLLLACQGAQASFWLDTAMANTQWNGEFVQELILWEDQGFGDTLQNLAWLEEASQRVGSLRLWLREPLQQLVRQRIQLPPNCLVETISSDSRPCHQGLPQLGIWFLPILMGGWRSGHRCLGRSHLRKFSNHKRPAIGLVWQAGRHSAPQPESAARRRDVPFPLLFHHAQQWAIPSKLQLFSLQLGAPDDPSVQQAIAAGQLLSGLGGGDWESTAQVVEQLALVVTVDTSMAHLCGSLGIPCVVLLGCPADWRWGQEGSRSFLYNSVRLARCPSPADWQGAVQAAAPLVAELLAET